MEYQKVVVTGEFDHRKELYMVPRSPLEDEHSAERMLGDGRQKIGALVITPFKLADTE